MADIAVFDDGSRDLALSAAIAGEIDVIEGASFKSGAGIQAFEFAKVDVAVIDIWIGIPAIWNADKIGYLRASRLWYCRHGRRDKSILLIIFWRFLLVRQEDQAWGDSIDEVKV